MDKLFGIPINTFMVELLVVLGVGLLVLGFFAWRNPVLVKMGVRNIARRRAQTALIVLGLMLTTLLFSSALVTGDTMKHSIDNEALRGYGTIDEIIIEKGDGDQQGAEFTGARTRVGDVYFGSDVYGRVDAELAGTGLTDGVTPAIIELAPVVAPDTKLSVPEITVLGVAGNYTEATGPLVTADGAELSTAALAPGETYISDRAAADMDVAAGDALQLFIGAEPMELTIAGTYTDGGKPSVDDSLVLPVEEIWAHTGTQDTYNMILISNTGDEFSGAELSSQVAERINPLLAGTSLEAQTVKQEVLDDADEAAATFTGIFLLFGEFSMIAGIMLIFLIFVMLAAERKGELGVMRALGSRRRDILKVFVFEGVAYSLMAAAIGAFAGIVVGWVMVRIMASAFGSFDEFNIAFAVSWKSIVIAYAMGMIATFVVVVGSAWRAGHINIVRAIRDLPEPKRRRRKLWIVSSALMIALGVLLTLAGLGSEQLAPFMLGTSLGVIGLPLLARNFGLPERAAFSIAGIGLLVWWMLPAEFLRNLLNLPDMTQGMEMFILSGVAIVAGAIWTVMYNSDILLALVVNIFRRVKGMPPLLKIAVNYPMRTRFRTGMALAMFALIIFTMSFMSAMLGSFDSIWDDTDRLSGGYDIQGLTGYSNPLTDVEGTIDASGEGISMDDIAAIGGVAVAPLELRQTGPEGGEWSSYVVQGADDGYMESVGYTFDLRADEYASDAAVWQALADDPTLAVVSADLVPAETNFNAGAGTPDFMLSGFFVEDETLPEVYIEARDPQTGEVARLRVVGVIEPMAMYASFGVFTSKDTIDAITAQPVPATMFWFRLNDGVDAGAASRALARTFFANGMDTTVTAENLADMMRANNMMNKLLQGFMGLGLVVGIAALGVIAARAVVERRHQIGMLRAIGFRRKMVQNTFLLESSFVSLLGVIIGTALGIGLCYNVMSFLAGDIEGISFKMPWTGILTIFVLAYGASLLTTYLPSRQAAKIYPAEALRYE